MAKDKNVLVHSNNNENTFTKFIRSDGEEIPAEISKKLSALNLHIYDSSDEDEKFDYNGSYGNFFAKK